MDARICCIALAGAALGCRGEPPASAPVFLRGAVLLPADAGLEGRRVGGDRVLVPWPDPGDLHVAGQLWRAPSLPGCAELFSVRLGDVSAWIARGGEPPDTALAFNRAGDRLAVGTWTGELLVLDAWTGEVLAESALSEAVVKRLAWAPNDGTLYAAEQSPDAWVLALDPDTLSVRARTRLADHVATSAPTAGDDLYGVYTLPAAYALEALANGDVIAVATHGWTEGGSGVRRNRARVLRFGPGLELRAAWPGAEAADAVVLAAAIRDGLLAVSAGRSADGPPPEGFAVDAVHVLALDGLVPVREVAIAPLEPWFDRTFIWEALALGPGGEVLAGLGDGRVVWSGPPAATDVLPLGTPIEVGDLAVGASIGQLVTAGGHRVFALTGGTSIPFGASHPDLRPEEVHPHENALFALDHAGPAWRTDWVWRGPHRLAGATLGPNGRALVVGAGVRDRDFRDDLFGALVFDLEASGPPTPVVCPTSGPVFFRHAVTADGRVAVAEHPWRTGDAVQGVYQVTVLR